MNALKETRTKKDWMREIVGESANGDSYDVILPGLAGHQAGMYEIDGQRVWIKTSPTLLAPQAGDWSTIRRLIEGTFIDDSGLDQSPYLYGWLKASVEGLYHANAELRMGQVLILLGPPGCGKSTLLRVITALLGGRRACASSYLYNDPGQMRELWAAEHLYVELPELAPHSSAKRVLTGENIKAICCNQKWRKRLPGRDALVLEPFWRLTMSGTDTVDSFKRLPMMTPDVVDKLMMFRLRRGEQLWPSDSLKLDFLYQLSCEIPAFLAWLLDEYVIPEGLRNARFGVKSFQHPSFVSGNIRDAGDNSLVRCSCCSRSYDPDTGEGEDTGLGNNPLVSRFADAGGWGAICGDCGAFVDGATRVEAVTNWNQHMISQLPPERMQPSPGSEEDTDIPWRSHSLAK